MNDDGRCSRIWFGLFIPLLLMNHVIGIRVTQALYGIEDKYETVASNASRTLFPFVHSDCIVFGAFVDDDRSIYFAGGSFRGFVSANPFPYGLFVPAVSFRAD